MGSATSELAAQDGPWVAAWLSQERLDVYLAATADRDDALALYEWNCEASAAVFRDLSHLEVALRNAYNHAIEAVWPGTGHWTDNPNLIFAPLHRTRGRGAARGSVDVNTKNRQLLTEARDHAQGNAAQPPRPGKIVAELSFGFWRYLSSSAQEKTMWNPFLHNAFPTGTDRRDVDDYVQGLHRLRNRVAHHEPLFTANLTAQHSKMIALATLIDPTLATYIGGRSTVPNLIATRPPLL